MTPPGTGAEVLAGGGPDSARSRRLPLLVGAVLLVLLLAAGGDALLRARSADDLLDRTAAATATARYVDRRVLGVADYVSPALLGASTPRSVRADLRRLLSLEAADQVPALRARVETVRAVRVLPWHGELRDARDAVVAHLETRLAVLDRVAQDSTALFRLDPAVQASQDRAESALLQAVGGQDAAVRVEQALDGT